LLDDCQVDFLTNEPLRPSEGSEKEIHNGPEQTVMNGMANHCGCDCEDEVEDFADLFHRIFGY